MSRVTFETKLWSTDYTYLTPEQMQTAEGAALLSASPSDMSTVGWTQVGTATVTAEIFPVKEMVDNKIAALRQQAANTRAEATAKCTQIEAQIQQLLAIENKPSEVEA